jgi:two-component system NtrC family sensor kinase
MQRHYPDFYPRHQGEAAMKKCSGWLGKILPPPRGNFMIRADLDRGYKRFSRGLSQILTVSVLVPMTVIAIVSHYQHRHLFEQEEQELLLLHLELGATAVEKFIAELKTVVRIVAVEDDYQELSDLEKFRDIFSPLQKEYPGFEEIEIVDAQGRRQYHVGLDHGITHWDNAEYAEQQWYRKVVERGVYVSNAFAGEEGETHFFIGVSGKIPRQEENRVMRVTVNTDILQDFIDTISTEYSEDLFLVDAVCVPLTNPGTYGRAGGDCILPKSGVRDEQRFFKTLAGRGGTLHTGVSPAVEGMRIMQRDIGGLQVIQASADLQNVPWKLILIKEPYLYGDAWAKFRIQLVAIFAFCAVVAVLVVFEISRAITGHLREAGLKRELFLARAEQPNKLASIGRLAAGVAHEINNPLAIINQQAGLVQDFLEMSDAFPHKQRVTEALEGVQNSVDRCKVITHRLLGFAHQTDVRIEEVNINALLHDVVDFLAEEAACSQIRIEFILDREIRHIYSDRGELLQIFLNITGNALDALNALSRGGNITLSSSQVDSETVRVCIADNGPGMTPKVQRHIFDPFFTTKETGRGTGLGLSIVYGLIRKLGGTVNVVSEVNRGAAFEVDLPIRQEE